MRQGRLSNRVVPLALLTGGCYNARMDDPGAALLDVLDTLRGVAGTLTAEEAAEQLDAATLQVFWREWPASSGWAGALWRRLNADLEQPARTPSGSQELRELGGSG